jgi:hypothetical protein
LVNEPAEPRRDPVGPGRGAAIAQAYYYVIAAIGLIFVLGGTIAALIALRKLILPASNDPSDFIGGPTDSNDAVRSLLGALAFAIPGALVLVWHLRQARRHVGRRVSSGSWGDTLYLHLVAAIALLIALGGAAAMLHSLRDSVLPFCYESPSYDGPVVGPGIEPGIATGIEPGTVEDFGEELSPIPPIELPADFDPEMLRSQDCFPSTSEALRGALDAGIVTSVAGAVWYWHLLRGRRRSEHEVEG